MLNIHTKGNLFVESMHLVGLLCISVEIDFDSGFGTGESNMVRVNNNIRAVIW